MVTRTKLGGDSKASVSAKLALHQGTESEPLSFPGQALSDEFQNARQRMIEQRKVGPFELHNRSVAELEGVTARVSEKLTELSRQLNKERDMLVSLSKLMGRALRDKALESKQAAIQACRGFGETLPPEARATLEIHLSKVEAEVEKQAAARRRNSGKPRAAKSEPYSPEELSRILGEQEEITKQQCEILKSIEGLLTGLGSEYPETAALSKVSLLVGICQQLATEDPMKMAAMTEIPIKLDRSTRLDSSEEIKAIYDDRHGKLKLLGQQCLKQLEDLSQSIRGEWRQPSQFGKDRGSARPAIEKLAADTSELLEQFSQRIVDLPLVDNSLAGQLVMAAGYAAQDDEAQVQTRIKSIKDLNASEEDWSKAIDSLHGADRISASALSSVLSRLGREETVKCIDLNHNTPDSFTELARLTLGERDEVEHMIYETLSLTQSHDKALRALGYVEGELIAALGSPEAAEALLKVRPALVVDYVEDPQKFERYCRLLRDHGPVMAQMHLQGALSIHDFSSLEAILRFDERELGRIRSASSAMPVIIRTLHEEAIDLLRELGMPAPVFTYAYLCHGPYRIEGSGKFVPKGLRTKETMYLFKRNPPKRLLADTEKLLLQSGILKADRFDGDATAVCRPDEVMPTNPKHAQVKRIVEIAQQQFKVRMPELAPDWK